MKIEGRKALVLGAGRSGVASAAFLAEKGAIVALHDRKPAAEWSDAARSLKTSHSIGLVDGDIPSWLLDQIDLVVISHTEPDQSGALGRLLQERPDLEVYCSRPSQNFLAPG